MIDWFSPRIAASLIVSASFIALTGTAIAKQGFQRWLSTRSRSDWAVDALGLTIQGTLIPLLQMALAAGVLKQLFPQFEGALQVPAWCAFLFCLVGVDYAYYWNHRILHTERLWPLHQVHHSAQTMDAWVSSRNTLWTSFLIVYLWLNGALIYFTGQESAILWAAGVTSALDLWRHSGAQLSKRAEHTLSQVLITPNDHSWHHSTDVYDINFGANFNFWDRLHGTYQKYPSAPEKVGIPRPPSTFKTLFWPYP